MMLALPTVLAVLTTPTATLPDPASLILGLPEVLQDTADATEHPWTGNIGLALNGSKTTTDSLSVRFNVSGTRKTDDDELSMSLVYMIQYADDELSENNGLFELEQLWNCRPDASWNAWVQGSVQFNAMEGYRTRVRTYGGVGYKVVNTDALTVNLKSGLGGRWDYRGNTSIIAQSLLETAIDWTIKDGLTVTATTSIANDLEAFSSYMFGVRVQLEMAVKAVDGLALTLGMREEYDSTPSAGSSSNQLWYWAGLQYGF